MDITYYVTIPTHEIVDKKVYYVIKTSTDDYWRQVLRRYSDLKTLNEKLIRKNHQYKLGLTLPLFPGRKFFSRTNENLESINHRSRELETYLNNVINIKKLHTFDSIKEFIPDGLEDSIAQFDNRTTYSTDPDRNQMEALKKAYLEKQDKKAQLTTPNRMTFNCYQRYYFGIDDYIEQGEVILYSVVMTDQKRHKKYKFTTRYSDLREYHLMLEKVKLEKISLPHFPKRKIISQTNENPLQILERQEQLESYLNSIFSIKELAESETLIVFLSKIKSEGKELVNHHIRQTQRVSDPPAQSNQLLFSAQITPTDSDLSSSKIASSL